MGVDGDKVRLRRQKLSNTVRFKVGCSRPRVWRLPTNVADSRYWWLRCHTAILTYRSELSSHVATLPTAAFSGPTSPEPAGIDEQLTAAGQVVQVLLISVTPVLSATSASRTTSPTAELLEVLPISHPEEFADWLDSTSATRRSTPTLCAKRSSDRRAHDLISRSAHVPLTANPPRSRRPCAVSRPSGHGPVAGAGARSGAAG